MTPSAEEINLFCKDVKHPCIHEQVAKRIANVFIA